MVELDRRPGGVEIATVVIVSIAVAAGGLWGILHGLARHASLLSRLLFGAMQGVGGAMVFGMAALLVVTVASGLWGLVLAAARRLRG
ncbi:hypothetical protein [Nocardioides montaniterrae]